MNIAVHANVIYTKGLVRVEFETRDGIKTAEFKHLKSWSHKKYVDKGMERLSLKPYGFLTYGWDMTAL